MNFDDYEGILEWMERAESESIYWFYYSNRDIPDPYQSRLAGCLDAAGNLDADL